MKIATDPIVVNCLEAEVYNRMLSLDNKHILELGCGTAQKTRDIATSGVNRKITALEVDVTAHQKNLQIDDLPNVEFALAGAQQIPLDNESVDIVMMFKSLHHVPPELMDASLGEINRVLKPGGLAYISEPVFSGDFNDILRLFNDEQKVRETAFNTLKKAVEDGMFHLVEETFFHTPKRYRDFAEFENTIINASYCDHRLDDKLFDQVKQQFEQHLGDNGANFLTPVRVDLLQK
ncbi:MAG: methyltransferase domain-containing protein [Xanthomonadales bacterium]|nr:methyltransferase domain-containing protein [Xanthomonadales bacterium]